MEMMTQPGAPRSSGYRTRATKSAHTPRLNAEGSAAIAAQKYDILSAIGAFGLAGDRGIQRLALRLITLITARYNWLRNELAVGQREIARLWSVDERTVKREMAKLRELGWLRLQKQGARGTVSRYSLDIAVLLDTTRSAWQLVGPDFTDRLTRTQAVPAGTSSGAEAGQHRNVIPFPEKAEDGDDLPWARVCARFRENAPVLYEAWIRQLVVEEHEGCLTVMAPSEFHASYVRTHLREQIFALCRAEFVCLNELRVLGPL